MKKIILSTILVSIFASCVKESNTSDNNPTSEIKFVQPSNFSTPVYNFSKNPVSPDGFALGKKLFYDGQLSRDGSISCGDCHQQSAGFTQHGHSVSHGIDNKLGTRNSPPIFNMAWHTTFFWDGGVHDLDLFSISPIENPLEMDEKMPNVVKKIQADKSYASLFQASFGTTEVTGTRMFQALSQFMNTLVSANSKYDKYIRKEEGVTLMADELAGLAIVQQKCQGCHKSDLFSDFSFRNNGIDNDGFDFGRELITLNKEDRRKFKVPSLRNLSYTAPYMHNGSFLTIDAVLEHYNREVKASPTLDPLLQQNGVIGIPLSDVEKKQIKAFLKTLDDETFIRDRRFSE